MRNYVGWLLMAMTIGTSVFGDTIKDREGAEHDGKVTFDGSKFELDYDYAILPAGPLSGTVTVKHAQMFFRDGQVEWVKFNDQTAGPSPAPTPPHGAFWSQAQNCKNRESDELLLTDTSEEKGQLANITKAVVAIRIAKDKAVRQEFKRAKVLEVRMGSCNDE